MPVDLSPFRMFSPGSLAEALEMLATLEGARPFAGGTDLMVELETGRLSRTSFVNLQSVPELSGGPRLDGRGRLQLGPLTTFRDTRCSAFVRESFPLLARASAEVGSLAVQASATWVGNIVNGSPAADGVPVLLVHDAELVIASRKGTRRMGLLDFHTGYKQNALEPGELVTQILLERPEDGLCEYYRKVGTRRFQAISKTLLAALGRLEGGRLHHVRLALASVAPCPFRARRTESSLEGAELSPERIEASVACLKQEIQPIDDLRSTAAYRRQVSGNLLRDFLSSLH